MIFLSNRSKQNCLMRKSKKKSYKEQYAIYQIMRILLWSILAKKPDIRYKPLDAIERLPAIQTAILENVCRYVRPGGTLLYSTCTVRKEENEDVARTFLLAHPEFSPEPFAVPAGLDLKNEGYATLLPQKHAADGFFICKLRRHA